MTPSSPITVRPAARGDAAALDRLAQLDSVRPLGGQVLVAEAHSMLVAAVSLDDGRAAADPFLSTADAVAVLQMRAAQLQPGENTGALRRLLVARRARRRPALRAA